MEIATALPLQAAMQTDVLEQANEALANLRADALRGAAVLLP